MPATTKYQREAIKIIEAHGMVIEERPRAPGAPKPKQGKEHKYDVRYNGVKYIIVVSCTPKNPSGALKSHRSICEKIVTGKIAPCLHQ